MISASSKLGGGPKHIFSLSTKLNNNFKIYYAMPSNEAFSNYFSENNHLEIAERKINLKDIFKVKQFVSKNDIDMIHAHGKGASVLARILKLLINKPLIYTFHGIHLECHNLLARNLYKFFELTTGFIDTCKIFVSKSESNYAKKFRIYNGKNYKIINNGVANKKIKNFEKLNIRKKQENKIKVITICRFVKQKNIEEILSIAKELEDIQFLILGNGPLWKNINFLIIKNKLKNILLIGESTNVFNYLYDSDIFLSTSLYEGLPISVLEAMSVGLPIVASNVVGNCDAIEHEKEGYLYTLNNVSMASKYISLLAKNYSKRSGMGKQSFQRQRKLFQVDLMIQKHMNLYNDVFNEFYN